MVKADDLECNEKHGVADSDRGIFGNILSAAALAAAGYNAYKAYDIAMKEWDMAKKYWRIAENWLDHYRNNYAPVEEQEVAEATDLPITEPKYEIARGRARTSAWIQYKGQLRKALRCTSRYCTGLRGDMLVRIMSAQSEAVALADGLGYRNERAYVEARNDVRWERRLNTVKRGRDIMADVPSLGMASAGIYGSLADQAWQGLQSAGMYLGWENNRNTPRYPETYLSGQTIITRGKFNEAAVMKSAGEAVAQEIQSQMYDPIRQYT